MKIHWKQEIRSLTSIALFALAVYLIFQSWELALLITAGLSIHELGHIVTIWFYGVDFEMGFSPFGAWTATPVNDRRKLSHFANALIHLAGPIFNLAYAFASLGIQLVFNPDWSSDYWLRLANFNALLGLLNLLPLGHYSDGGKLLHRLFVSVKGTAERLVWLVLAVWMGALIWFLVIIRFDLMRVIAVALISAWFLIQAHLVGSHYDQYQETFSTPLSDGQAILILGLLVIAFILGSLVTFTTPFWLNRAQVYHMINTNVNLFILLFFRSPMILRVGLIALVILALILLFLRRHLRADRTSDQYFFDRENS